MRPGQVGLPLPGGLPLHECGVGTVARKSLPLDKDRALADAVEIWEPDIGPLGDGSHIDQDRSRIRLEPCPGILNRDAFDVDIFHAATLNAASLP